MNVRREVRATIAIGLASLLACPPARALVALNDGRDRIYVNGSVTVGYDSNIFASNGSEGDTVYSTAVSADELDVVLARMEQVPGVLHATWEVSTRD